MNTSNPKVSSAIWQAGAILLCVWATLFFAFTNLQLVGSLRLLQSTWMVAFGVFLLLLYYASRCGRAGWLFWCALSSLMTVAWLGGLHDPIYWDGIQTSGRSQLLYMGEWDKVHRFTGTYVILGALYRILGNENWVSHLYMMVMGAVVIVLATRQFRAGLPQVLACLGVFLSPWIFVLSKWVFLDIPPIAGMMASIGCYCWLLRKPTPGRFVVTLAVAIVTAFLKENGMIAAIPALAMPLLARKGQRLRVSIYTIIIVACMVAALYIGYRIYRDARTTVSRGDVQWILFNGNLGTPAMTARWVWYAFVENLGDLGRWGLLLPAFIGLVRVRRRGGQAILAGILLYQLYILYSLSEFRVTIWWSSFPLSDSNSTMVVPWSILGAMILLGTGLMSGTLCWRRLGSVELMSVLMVLGNLLAFSVAGKLGDEGVGKDWRYMAPAAPFLAILAANGMAMMMTRQRAVWVRVLAVFTFGSCLYFMAVRSANLSIFASTRGRMAQAAYDAAVAQPERVVYTHWPYVYMTDPPMDYGSLDWRSEGFTFRPISELGFWYTIDRADREGRTGIVVMSEDHRPYYDLRRTFNEAIFSGLGGFHYARPFDSDLRQMRIQDVHVGRVTVDPLGQDAESGLNDE